MSVNFTKTALSPYALAALGEKIVSGTPNVGTDPGLVRPVEAQNWVVKNVTAQHIGMTFSGSRPGFSSPFATPITPAWIDLETNLEIIHTDIWWPWETQQIEVVLGFYMDVNSSVVATVTLTGWLGSQVQTISAAPADNGHTFGVSFDSSIVGPGSWAELTVSTTVTQSPGWLTHFNELRKFSLTEWPLSSFPGPVT